MNLERYIKKNILGHRGSFLFKTPPGFKKHIEIYIREYLEHQFNRQVFTIDSSHVERGVIVKGLTLREASVLAISSPFLSDYMYLVSDFKSGHESDLSRLDAKKFVVLVGSAAKLAINLIGYQSISRDVFVKKLVLTIAKQKESCGSIDVDVDYVSCEDKYDSYLEAYYRDNLVAHN